MIKARKKDSVSVQLANSSSLWMWPLFLVSQLKSRAAFCSRSAEGAASVLIRSWSPACSDSLELRLYTIRKPFLIERAYLGPSGSAWECFEDRVPRETQAQRFPVAGEHCSFDCLLLNFLLCCVCTVAYWFAYVSSLDFAVIYDFQTFSDEHSPLGSKWECLEDWESLSGEASTTDGFVLQVNIYCCEADLEFRVFVTSCFAVF